VHTQTSFRLQFLILQTLLLTTPSKYSRSSPRYQNLQNLISYFHVTIFFPANQLINRCFSFLNLEM